jgi:Ca2+-transporting ATPase
MSFWLNNTLYLQGLLSFTKKRIKKDECVFRTTPEETRSIVEACQTRNEIIALVAGSVNDAESLAIANIGIASNQTSTDIAIKAADIVLNEDSLSTIVHGIEAGRILFENLQV